MLETLCADGTFFFPPLPSVFLISSLWGKTSTLKNRNTLCGWDFFLPLLPLVFPPLPCGAKHQRYTTETLCGDGTYFLPLLPSVFPPLPCGAKHQHYSLYSRNTWDFFLSSSSFGLPTSSLRSKHQHIQQKHFVGLGLFFLFFLRSSHFFPVE